MTATAEVILASQYKGDPVLYTVECRYWRAIHSEVMTHRVFSRNASSSRAIPVRKVLKQVWSDPAGPTHWGLNQPGMQASKQATGFKRKVAKVVWRLAGKMACVASWSLMELGIHKQVANRLLEPWQYISVIITATDWDNFFALRLHPDAQPEIKELAEAIEWSMGLVHIQQLKRNEWHLPYVDLSYYDQASDVEAAKQVSAARCARVSYLTHDGKKANIHSDLKLASMLQKSKHMSPFEHQAKPGWRGTTKYANLTGWMSQRYLMENQK